MNDASRVAVEPVSSFDWTANPPYIKLPSALGIVLATLLNLGSFPLFYLGRFFNLLMFAALAYFAVRITPVGKNAMMVAGLLPMTLHLASSYSYDAGIMGFGLPIDGYVLASRVRRGPYEPKGKRRGSLSLRFCLLRARWCTRSSCFSSS